MKILICEDEEILLTAIEFRLRKQGFDVIKAKNGREALQLIATDKPDLIVADLLMPYVNGFSIIHNIRNIQQSALPIIIISALEEESTILDALRMGANDFITKPFKPNELILRIKSVFQELEKLDSSPSM